MHGVRLNALFCDQLAYFGGRYDRGAAAFGYGHRIAQMIAVRVGYQNVIGRDFAGAGRHDGIAGKIGIKQKNGFFVL
jgi:hypothetical protein